MLDLRYQRIGIVRDLIVGAYVHVVVIYGLVLERIFALDVTTKHLKSMDDP